MCPSDTNLTPMSPQAETLPSPASSMPSSNQRPLLSRWTDAAHRYLDEAAREDNAGAVQRWTIAAGIATDKIRDLDAKPIQTILHVHSVDLGQLAGAFMAVAQRLHPAQSVPTTIDASFVPLSLPLEHRGAVGQAGDVGMGSGVPRRQSAGTKVAAPRKPRGAYKRHKPVLPEVDPLKPLARARVKLKRKAARARRDA